MKFIFNYIATFLQNDIALDKNLTIEKISILLQEKKGKILGSN